MFGSQITMNELEYWSAFFVLQKAEMYDVDSKLYDVLEVVDEINYKIKERNKKLNDSHQTGAKKHVVYSGK